MLGPLRNYGWTAIHTVQLKHFWLKTFILQRKYGKHNGLYWSIQNREPFSACLMPGQAAEAVWGMLCVLQPGPPTSWSQSLLICWPSLSYWSWLWGLYAGSYSFQNAILSSCMESLTQPFTFRSTLGLRMSFLPQALSGLKAMDSSLAVGSGHTVCLITERHAPLLAYFWKAVLCLLSAGRSPTDKSLGLRYWSKDE